MGVNLTKGQKVSLTKGNPGLSKVGVGLGWDVNKFDTGTDFDLDASAFFGRSIRPRYTAGGFHFLRKYDPSVRCGKIYG